jgi:hypothetical protein
MKTTYLASTAMAVVFLAGPAMAGGAMWSGAVSLQGGARICENTDDTNCGGHFAWGGDARLGATFGSIFVQGDVQYEEFTNPDDESDQVLSGLTAGGHFALRTNEYLVGVFAGAGRMDVSGTDDWGGVYGAEGQYYWDDTTLYGQVGYADIEEGTDSEFNGWFGTVTVRQFISDTFLVHANLGYGYSDEYEDNGANQWGEIFNYGFGARFGLCGCMPLYMTVDYRGGDYTANTEDFGDDNSILFGLIYEFGAENAKTFDRNGASLNMPQLPSRSASWAQALD